MVGPRSQRHSAAPSTTKAKTDLEVGVVEAVKPLLVRVPGGCHMPQREAHRFLDGGMHVDDWRGRWHVVRQVVTGRTAHSCLRRTVDPSPIGVRICFVSWRPNK